MPVWKAVQINDFAICADCGGLTCVDCIAKFPERYLNVRCADVAVVSAKAVAHTTQKNCRTTFIHS